MEDIMIICYDYILNKQNLSSLTEKEQDLFFLLLYSFEEDGVIENAEYKLVKEYIFDPSYSNKRVEETIKSLVSKLEKMVFVKEDGEEVPFNILTNLTINSNDKSFGVELNKDFDYLIRELHNKRGLSKVNFDLRVFFKIKGKYTKSLYRLLMAFCSLGTRKFKESFLIERLGIDEKLPYSRKKKKVIDELEKMKDLFVDFGYKEVRKGAGARKYQLNWDINATKRFNNLKV
ncbi:replication initiation protein [Peptostreptococcus sp.]